MGARRLRAWLGVWLGLVLAACGAPAPPPATPAPAVIAVTDLAAPLAADLAAAYRAVGPAPRLTVASQAALSAELAAHNAGLALTANPAPGQFATPVGYITLAVVVHPQNPVAALSLAQTRALFAGQITDWAQVGAAGGPVQPVVREPGADGALAFAAVALAGQPPAANSLIVPTWEAMRAALEQSPGAVGYLPLTELTNAVRLAPVAAPLRVLISAVALAEPAGADRDFLTWAQSAAGQEVVAARHEPLP